MTKLEYLKLAIKFHLYQHKSWIITAFAIVKQSPDKQEYEGQIVRQPWGYGCFINNEIVKIDDTDSKEPLFSFKDRVMIDPTWVPNIKEPTETSVGNVLFNSICILTSFGPKFPFALGTVSVSNIEDFVAPLLRDTPRGNQERQPGSYYVDEYVKFVDALQYLSNLSQLTAWSATPKSLVAPTGIKEFKAQLLEKYKGKLHDPVELSKFEGELLDFDDKFLQDDPAYGTFLKGKVKDTARKKMYLSIGADKGFTDSLDVVPVTNSLEEGWPTDPTEFTALMNSLRSGSFSRGAETVKGGVSAKIMLRAGNNYTIQDTDCQVTYGITRIYNENSIGKLVGRYVITKIGPVLIDSQDKAKNYIGSKILVRSPMYCRLSGPNLCRICAGENLFKFPTGVTIPLTEISGIILATNLKLMHSNVLSTAKLDIHKHFT